MRFEPPCAAPADMHMRLQAFRHMRAGGAGRRSFRGQTVAKPELGNKHQCQHCGTKFFDLNKTPVVCPKCGAVQQVTAARMARAGAAEEDEIENEAGPELVSLDEAETAKRHWMSEWTKTSRSKTKPPTTLSSKRKRRMPTMSRASSTATSPATREPLPDFPTRTCSSLLILSVSFDRIVHPIGKRSGTLTAAEEVAAPLVEHGHCGYTAAPRARRPQGLHLGPPKGAGTCAAKMPIWAQKEWGHSSVGRALQWH